MLIRVYMEPGKLMVVTSMNPDILITMSVAGIVNINMRMQHASWHQQQADAVEQADADRKWAHARSVAG